MENVKTTSHDIARDLQKLAEHLLSRPPVEWNEDLHINSYRYVSNYDKGSLQRFVSLLKTLGSFEKKTDSSHWIARYRFGRIQLDIYTERSSVCRKVQEEKWECDSIIERSIEAEMREVQP